jgi:hypothetical protein
MLQNLRGSRTSSEIPRAKRAKVAKVGNQFLFFAPFAIIARDIPRLTGARSAPYEN